MLAVTYEPTWFMNHCVGKAMREINSYRISGDNKTVEIYETYVGGNARNQKRKTFPKEAAFELADYDR